VDLSDGLANDGQWCGGAGCRGELFIDIERGLVLLATLRYRNCKHLCKTSCSITI
jgi:hypothetical protein